MSAAFEFKPALIRFYAEEAAALEKAAEAHGMSVNVLVRKVVAHSVGAGAIHDRLESERQAERQQHQAHMVSKRWEGHEKQLRSRKKKTAEE